MGTEVSNIVKRGETVESEEPGSHSRLIPKTVFLIILAALLSIIPCIAIGTFTSATELVMTFWISFLIGLGGAGVYLSLFLMTEKHLKILQNRVTDNLGFMTFLFLLSGGFVAAVTQVTAGPLLHGNIQTVFLVGFGWLGALSGVAGVGERAELNRENTGLTNQKTVAENERKIADALKEENEEMKKVIDALEKKLKGGG